jgi:hypothetical protein
LTSPRSMDSSSSIIPSTGPSWMCRVEDGSEGVAVERGPWP